MQGLPCIHQTNSVGLLPTGCIFSLHLSLQGSHFRDLLFNPVPLYLITSLGWAKTNFYRDLYVTESKRRSNNSDVFCKGIDFDGSHFLTTDHDLHRRRRKPLEPFFSRQGVTKLQPMLAEVALDLESRFRELERQNNAIRLDHAFSAFSGDVIARICLDSDDSENRFLNHPDFSPEWYEMIDTIIRSIPLFTGFPWIVRIINRIPESILLWAYPRGHLINRFKQAARHKIRQAMALTSGAAKDADNNGVRFSLFHHIANNNMPESERSEERLAKEAQTLLGSGTASTARTICFAAYYILANSQTKPRVEAELRGPMADWPGRVPSWAELERLPFLQAIIQESLRLSYGVMHRLPRVSPDLAIQYKHYTIPPGVAVGMSAYLMHSDPEVFPSPGEFIPERWLGDIDPRMNRNFVPFCKGLRSCLGMNLAMAEMSLILAVLYRPNGPKFELFETDESDVKQAHDFIIPLPKLTSKGVRVAFTGRRGEI
ncbi:Cytochrome P450 [Rhypophila decipiens]